MGPVVRTIANPASAAILSLLMLAACGRGTEQLGRQVTVKLPSVETASPSSQPSPQAENLTAAEAPQAPELAAAATIQSAAAASSRYSSLEPSSCELLGGTGQERAFARRRCAGTAGYALERSESDPLHDLAIVSPRGTRSELDLAALVPGGGLGATAEWRGRAPGQPRALIMRLNAENKDPLGPATS